MTKRQFDLTGAIIDYEKGKLDQDATVELFQYLVDTGLAWQLQGMYGREAVRLIEAGLVKRFISTEEKDVEGEPL